MGENKFQQFRKPADQKSAGESQAKEIKEIRVVAIRDGWWANSRISPGMEFVVPENKFSSTWMEKVKSEQE
jgi:hypothetical protein